MIYGNDTNVIGRRILATFIDALLLGAAFFGIGALFGDFHNSSSGSSVHFSVVLGTGATLAYVAICFGYYFLFEAAFGATVGKFLVGVRVLGQDGSRAGPAAVLIRTLLRVIDGLPFLYLIGLVSASMGEMHQRLGDRAGHTVVVRADAARRPASTAGFAGA